MNKTITLSIKGMTCGSCVRHVSSALRRVEGVRGAEVDLAAGLATVVTDESTPIEDLQRAVTEAGYESSPAAGA